MIEVNYTIEGLKEINRVLQKLPLILQERVIKSAVRSGAQIIRKAAKALVPRDSGELEQSIVVQAARTKSRNFSLFRIGFKKPTSRRAHLTEFGTSTQPAQPFMRPALDNNATAVIQKIVQALGRGLAREAEKLVGRGRNRR